MRMILTVALTLGLSACSDWDGSFFGSGDAHEAQPADAVSAPAGESAPAASPAPAQLTQAQAAESPQPQSIRPRDANGHCAKLARQRASDAAYAGEDEETQQSVYDRTYAGCMDWDAKHTS